MSFTDTEVILTGLAGVTVRVHGALSPDTASAGLPHSAGRAGASEGVSADPALCPRAAGVGIAGVRLLHTAGLGTDKPVLTVGVNHALWATACDGVWLRHQAWETPADGVALAAGLTGGAGPTGTGLAGVWPLHTSLAPADLSVVTVRVNHALRTTASDGVGLGDETRQAPADGVAVTVRGAGSTRAARAGLTGVQDGASNLRAGVG